MILAAIVVTAGFIGGAIAGRFLRVVPAYAQEDNTITAKTLKVNDANGHPRIILSTTADANEKPIVMLLDEKATPLQVYGLTDKDEPTFSVMDKKGSVRIGGAITESDGPGLFINDQNDKIIWSAP